MTSLIGTNKEIIHHDRPLITRRRVLSFALLLIALLTLYGATQFAAGVETILKLDVGSPDEVPSAAVPVRGFLIFAGFYFGATAVLGLVDPPRLRKRLTPALLILAGVLIFPTILISAAAGNETNVVTLIVESLRLATPIAIGAMAGIWCERSGVINIAIEGMMLFSACIGFTVVFLLRGAFPAEQLTLILYLGVLGGIVTGGVVALLHAWLSITFSTDQIVSGTVINIMAIGTTSFIRREVLLSAEGGLRTLPAIEIPLLSDIPVIGPQVFVAQPIFIAMFFVVALTHLVLFYTAWGLRTRSVGENPHAADTLGVDVNRIRWVNVFIGGCIAGLAGAWFSLEATGRFSDNMTNGTGFIALAAMIFGKWMPFGAFGGSLLFSFSSALGDRFQILGVDIPQQFLQMVPYIVTLVVLAGLVGRATPPKAIGKPYNKESTD